ncbi:M3 family oligoendopeptidase [Oceanithermus sp.]|uniref:M3 family oligoendopeptidase n=1 Tax=Oceanithermus sp. TaxID=2268145 RepID=UPI00257F495C|nr:M3 family oligoendopeptidase [Oceanithermus sp.]
MDATLTPERWTLEDLFGGPQSPEFKRALEALDEKAAALQAVRDELKPGLAPERFLEIVRRVEELADLMHRAYAAAGLWFYEDTQNPEAQALLARVRQKSAEVENQTLFFELWFKDLPDAEADRLIAAAGERYRYWLEQMRAWKPYTLSEGEEKIVNLKNATGRTALDTLYDTITSRYKFTLEVDGESLTLTRGELMVYARDPRPEVRAAAYRELYRVYAEDAPVLAQIYQNIVSDWKNEYLEVRGFQSAIAVRNKINDLPDAVVETLLEVSRKNAPLFQRYFRLKARVLGMERLRRYDVYAPVTKAEKRYDYAEARRMVDEAFAAFDPRFAELAARVFERRHVDAEVREGKAGGAFCWTPAPGTVPWVLLNYQGRPDDVSTMAHELGHAVHGMLAGEHPVFTFHAPMPLAETASTFAEMLLVDHLLASESDAEVRRQVLFDQMDGNYATILRQAYFALFEIEAHRRIPEGASADELKAAYRQNLEEQFGEAVELSDEFDWEWISIPHIYGTPFYVYAYAFGQLLVLALYRRYREEGEAFKPRLFRILEAGGSVAPAELLAREGFDITDPAFWQGGFDVIAELLSKLEAEAGAASASQV